MGMRLAVKPVRGTFDWEELGCFQRSLDVVTSANCASPFSRLVFALVMKTGRVKLREDVLHQWIIVQVQNENLACGSAAR
jgi:hypothetical protein